MASQFSEYWNYQQYYKTNSNTDYYRSHQSYSPQSYNNQYYHPTPYIKEETITSTNVGPPKYPKYGSQNLLQSCLESNITSPPNTPVSGPNPNEDHLAHQYNPASPYNYPEINRPQNSILDSPPKTPISSSTNPEVPSISPEKPCDSPALRALLTRKDKKSNDRCKNYYGDFYEKANYLNSGFCGERNSYVSDDLKAVSSPPMGNSDNGENAKSSMGAESMGAEEYGQTNDVKMAIADIDVFPWMKTGKGNYQTIFKH